jgi:HEAT repeat protein
MHTEASERLAVVVPTLLAALGTAEGKDRTAAVGALAALGPGAAGAVPALIDLLKEPETCHAAFALGEIGPPAAPAVSTLCDALLAAKREGYWGSAEATALVLIGSEAAVPALVEAAAIDDGHTLNMWLQVDFDDRGTEASAAIPVLVQLLDAPPFAHCYWILCWIGKFYAPGSPGIDVLRQALQNPEGLVRRGAVDGLYKALCADPTLGPSLGELFLPLLEDNYSDVAGSAAMALGVLRDPRAVPALARVVGSRWCVEGWCYSPKVSALHALQQIGVISTEVHAALRVCMHDEDDWFRCEAALAAGRLGNAASELLPVLMELRAAGRLQAAWLPFEQVVAGLRGNSGPLQSWRDPRLGRGYWRGEYPRPHRDWGRWSPRKGSGIFRDTVPLLVQVVLERAQADKQRALHALTAIGPDSATAVPALLRSLAEATTPELCDAIADALGSIGPAAHAAVPALADLLLERHPAGDARSASRAAEALLHIDSLHSLPAFIQAAHSIESGWLVRDAICAIRYFGRNAAGAIPALEGLLKDPRYTEYVGDIVETLVAIEPSRQGRPAE